MILDDSNGTAGLHYSSHVGDIVDPSTIDDAHQYCTTLFIDGQSQWYRFLCHQTLKGRYVTLKLSDSMTVSKQLAVCEMQIFYGNTFLVFRS